MRTSCPNCARSLKQHVDSAFHRALRLERNAYKPLFALLAVAVAGCGGSQSTLAPAGREAETIAALFWWMAGGAVVIWTVVTGLILYSITAHPGPKARQMGLLIIGGGAVVPTIVLAVLLTFGLATLPKLVAPVPPECPRIHVVGEQWWWRVTYRTHDGDSIPVANEIHLPVGEPVEFLLDAADVIHAFWIPALGGKVDMIPGRTNRLRLEPTKVGVYRGVCAEYCGEAHAEMSFIVIVEEKKDYDNWLSQQTRDATEPTGELAQRGKQVFLSSGCGACHTIRGTPADGRLGPDLSHLGSRKSIAAGTLTLQTDNLLDWLSDTHAVKEGVHMPSFGMLPEADLRALTAYLEGLD